MCLCAHCPVWSSPGSLSHLGTFPGSDLVGLAAWACADGSCSSCVDLLVPAVGSRGGSGSSEAGKLEEGVGDWSMQLSSGGGMRKRGYNKKQNRIAGINVLTYSDIDLLAEDLCQTLNNSYRVMTLLKKLKDNRWGSLLGNGLYL